MQHPGLDGAARPGCCWAVGQLHIVGDIGHEVVDVWNKNIM